MEVWCEKMHFIVECIFFLLQLIIDNNPLKEYNEYRIKNRRYKLTDSSDFNFFRGTNEDRTMIDLYNVQYIFEGIQ